MRPMSKRQALRRRVQHEVYDTDRFAGIVLRLAHRVIADAACNPGADVSADVTGALLSVAATLTLKYGPTEDDETVRALFVRAALVRIDRALRSPDTTADTSATPSKKGSAAKRTRKTSTRRNP